MASPTTLRALSFTLLISATACGGKVVFEPSGTTSGAGGSSPYWTPKTPGGCSLEPPVGAVTSCAGTPPSSSGGSSCVTTLCDEKGNAFVAICKGKTCDCTWNGNSECSCDISEGDFCAGTPICCH